MSALELPLFFRFGAKKASMIKLLVIIGLAILFTLVFALAPENVQEDMMTKILDMIQKIPDLMLGNISRGAKIKIYFASFFSVVLYLSSMKLSEKIYLKGAEEYN